MVVEELAEFVVLTGEVGEVDEESAAHVPLHGLHLLRPGWSIVLDQEVAVFQQSSAAYLLRTPCSDQFLVQVTQSILKVAVDRLAHHCGVEVVADLHPGAVVEEEESVEHDVERVHGELVFSLHAVHKFQLHWMCFVVSKGN